MSEPLEETDAQLSGRQAHQGECKQLTPLTSTLSKSKRKGFWVLGWELKEEKLEI